MQRSPFLMTVLGFSTNLSREEEKWSATAFGGKKRSPRVLLARRAERPGSGRLTREAADAFMSVSGVSEDEEGGKGERADDAGGSLGGSVGGSSVIERLDELCLLVVQTHS